MTRIKGRDYYILNLTLGEFILDEYKSVNRLKLSDCTYRSIKGAVKLWNEVGKNNRWIYINIHTPCSICEFKLVEIEDEIA